MNKNIASRIPGEIRSIRISENTFRRDPVTFEPTLINYFYGNNGTGKSTVARNLKEKRGLTFHGDRKADDYQILVFDRNYIEKNVSELQDLPGVFTLGETNQELLNTITEKTARKEALLKDRKSIGIEYKRVEAELADHPKKVNKTCWDRLDTLRELFKPALTNAKKYRSELLIQEIRKATPTAHDISELQKQFEYAFKSDSTRFQTLSLPDREKLEALDELAENELFELSVVNSANTDFARFIRKLGAAEWVQEGRQHYLSHSNGHCPFCYRPIPDDLYETLTSGFDAAYQENIDELKSILTDYQKTAEELIEALAPPEVEMLAGFDHSAYNAKHRELKNLTAENIKLIRKKIRNPEISISLKPAASVLEPLCDMITQYNKSVSAHNRILENLSKEQAACTKKIFDLMAYHVQDTLKNFDEEEAVLKAKRQELLDNGKKVRKEIDDLCREIGEIQKQIRNTESVKDSINSKLLDCGFQGFALRTKTVSSQADGKEPSDGICTYEIIRPDTGETAKGLSEGERNFIAFLYFYHQVFGSETKDIDPREKIVVIDDPVSSMDTGTLFAVSALVRNMIEVCRNNA